MRRYFLTILFSTFALCLLADEPQQYTIDDLIGAKIASVDAYNFEWNNNTGIPTIIESDYAMMGKSCALGLSSSTGEIYLSGFYSVFSIPVDIELVTGIVTIEVNKALCRTKVQFEPINPVNQLREANTSRSSDDSYWTLYAMPLSWLMGDDLDNIHGQVNEDGSITFNDDFAFLVSEQLSGKDTCTWGMSPIFRNLKLLNPNGTHEFTYTWLAVEYPDDPDPSGHGHGGLVPRNPGTKPVKPRPFSAIIGTDACLNGNPKMKPGNPVLYSIRQTDEVRPVYMEKVDDTTMMVYNLFGKGNRCYMNINRTDGTFSLPRQQIANDGLGHVLYNDSCFGTCSQNTFTWDKTTVSASDYPKFSSNVLTFTNDSPIDVPLAPRISCNVFDTTVEFYAMTEDFDGIEVLLYIYEEGIDDFIDVENPLSLPRQVEPYWVSIAAIAYNSMTGVCSEMVWSEYEVPALPRRGDVNADGEINVTDAILLINALLNDNWSDMDCEAADVDYTSDVNITDVIMLINYILNDETNADK